jgi:hypothetical protein
VGCYFVKIRTQTWERLRDLQQIYDLDVFGKTANQSATGGFEIQGLLADEQIEQLRADGYEIEAIGDAEQLARERLQELARRHSTPDRGMEDGGDRTASDWE